MVFVTYLPVSLIFLSYSAAILAYGITRRHHPDKEHHLRNEVLVAMLFALAGLLYPFMFLPTGIDYATQDQLFGLTNYFIVTEMLVWAAFITKGALETRNNPVLKESRNWENFKEEFRANYKYDFMKDVKRKALHLLPVAVILFFWTLGVILANSGTLAQMSLTQPAFSYWLIVTVGYGFVLMFATADLCRLSGRAHWLPLWAITWFTKSMKTDELETFVSSSPLVLSFVPFVFTPFPVFASVALITSLGDAAASLVGKKFGKHRFPRTSKKTIEGYLAGGFSTFLLVVLAGGLYPVVGITWITIIAMAVFATFVFLSIDVFANHVSDNILNPLLCGAVMMFAIYLF